MLSGKHGETVGKVNEDDALVTRPAAEVTVRCEPIPSATTAGEGGETDGADEWLAPGTEEAGYGYGV